MPKRTREILKEFFTTGAVPVGATFSDMLDSMVDNNAPTTLEVVSGAITVTQRRHKVDTEDQSAADDLDTISGLADGEEVIFRCVDASRVVTFKNGTGNLDIGSDFALSAAKNVIHLWYNGDTAKVEQIARNS